MSIGLILLILLALVVIFVIAVIVSYNRFVRQRNLVRESWRQIDVELQRRHDLIPNLVETVKGFAGQERTVLIAVTEARAQAEKVRRDPNAGAADQALAENNLGRAMTGLFATVEAYPDLKSNQNFLALQQQLAETEDRIASGRRYYNANVRNINTRVEAFPSNVIAGVFHFKLEEYFEVDDPQVRGNVQVDFGEMGSGGGIGSTAQVPPTPPAPPAQPPSA
ncbi:MAG: LemA family protein [Mycobacteriales bacterium]